MNNRRSNLSNSRSCDAFRRAELVIPGGVNSPARAFAAVGGIPIFLNRGKGAHVFDVDGNRYIDFVGSWGPLILGHAHPDVLIAIQRAASRGTSFGAPTDAESELAEIIVNAIPSIEKVRFVSSGTEATMSAIRLARGFTGRNRIVKFAGNYHGHVDSLLVAAGSSAATHGVTDSQGVPNGVTSDTIVLEYNDPGALEHVFESCGKTIAGVIFEPVAGNMGVVRPTNEFLVELRRSTLKHGAILICDEVMTGFRVEFGGAQSRFEFTPDITTLGKIIGGGLPIGAFGGRADIMDCLAPAGGVFQAGTLSGNPVATAAGIATLRHLRDNPPYDYLETLTSKLEHGLRLAAENAGIAHTIGRAGSMITLFFYDEHVQNWSIARRCDTDLFASWFWEMIDRGVYFPCSQFEAAFVSAAHTEHDVDAVVDAANDGLQAIRSRSEN